MSAMPAVRFLAAEAVGFRDSQGRPLSLGRSIGRGGEGEVFLIPDRPGLAAKLLHDPLTPDRVAKIQALTRLRSPAIEAAAAWPVDLVADAAGRPRGLLMPLVLEHRELHELYTPRSRMTAFPAADAAFLLGVGVNLARAFAAVHHVGCVIGDVNHASVLVSGRGLVRLIDCDSFQIRDGGRLLTCDVGQALFTPTELQGQPLRGRERTPDHDAFGLSVLLFQLLFMGRHPFAGRYLKSADMPIERAIAEGRFAYGAGARQRDMSAPPNTLPLDVYGLPVADLFERAFGKSSGRPSAREWLEVLAAARAELRRCADNDRHAYRSALADCPFCAIERETGAFLFGFSADRVAGDRGLPLADRVKAAWDAVCKIALPTATAAPAFDDVAERWRERRAPPVARAASETPLDEKLRTMAVSLMVLGGVGAVFTLFIRSGGAGPGVDNPTLSSATAIGLAAFGLGALLSAIADRLDPRRPAPPVEDSAQRLRRLHALNEVEELKRRWGRAAAWEQDLARARRKVEDLMRAWTNLPGLRRSMFDELTARDHERQLARHLHRFPIADAGIPHIGPTRTATLQSYGIWTAGDATEANLQRVPGFGPQRINSIQMWRSRCSVGFTPGPPLPPDPAEIAHIEREVALRARRLADQIVDAPVQLEAARRTIVQERRGVMTRLDQLAQTAPR